jgi:hypothetical protein
LRLGDASDEDRRRRAAVLDRDALARRLRGQANRAPGFDTSEEPLDTALPAIKDPNIPAKKESDALLRRRQRAVVVAVVAVRVVEVAVDEIVDMVAMRDAFVAAAGPVLVAGIVARAFVAGRAGGGIGLGDVNAVLVDMVAVRMMQMAVVQIVDVVAVLHSRVAAVRPVLMGMAGVLGLVAIGHHCLLDCAG